MTFCLSRIMAGIIAIAVLTIGACTSTELPAETVSSHLHKFRVVPLAKGLEHPWSIALNRLALRRFL